MIRSPSRISYYNDRVSRMVMRGLLLLQLGAMVVVLGFCLLDRFVLALKVSLLTLCLLLAVIAWLYARYRALTIVCEKKILTRLVLKFEDHLQAEQLRIYTAIRERTRLVQAEKEEIQAALSTLQKNHIRNGLKSASIDQAAIPGIGPRLTQRLAGYGITSAADVSNRIAQLPGFGVEKCHALLGWRSSVLANLERTKPSALPPEELEAIQQKYQALQDKNNAAERKAITSQQLLEHELMSLKPRLRALASITFPGYLSKSLNRDDSWLPRSRLNWSPRKWFPPSARPWRSARRTPRR